MVQKIGAQFVVKKVADYVMAPPPEVEEEEAEQRPSSSAPAASANAKPANDLDGQTITDEHGEALGVARRVANVAVYLVTDARRDLGAQLEQTIVDPEMRVFFAHDDRGELSGLIYVPDPAKRPVPPAALRADDI